MDSNSEQKPLEDSTPKASALPAKVYVGSGQKTAFDRTEQVIFKIYSAFILIGMVMTLFSLLYGFEPGLIAIYGILLLFIFVIKEVRKLYEKQQVILGKDTFEQILGDDLYSYNYADIEEISFHHYFGSEDVAFIIFKYLGSYRLLLRIENMNQLAADLEASIGTAKVKKAENILSVFFLSEAPSWSIPMIGVLCIAGYYYAHHYDLRIDFLVSMALLLVVTLASYSYLGVSWGRKVQSKILWIFPLIMIYSADLAHKNHEVNQCKISFNESCFRYTYFYGDTLFTDTVQKEHDQMDILRLGCEKSHAKSCMELGARMEETAPTTALEHFQKSCSLNLGEGCVHSARVLAKKDQTTDSLAFLERGLQLGFKSFWFVEENEAFASMVKDGSLSKLLAPYKADPGRVPAAKK